MQDMKMQDMKMQYRKMQDMKMQDRKMQDMKVQDTGSSRGNYNLMFKAELFLVHQPTPH